METDADKDKVEKLMSGSDGGTNSVERILLEQISLLQAID
jgi:hypothetical protein